MSLPTLLPSHACRSIRVLASLMAMSLLLVGCGGEPTATTVEAARPSPRPAVEEPATVDYAALRRERAERNRSANAAAATASSEASDASRSQRAFYAAVEQRLLDRGRLRRDRVPLDAPIDAATLARNFMEIALQDEYSDTDDGLVARTRPSPLRRWQEPVRIQLDFGASTGMAERPAWRSEVADYAAHLSSVTGHRVGMTARNGNFVVLVLTEDERRSIGPRLAELVPGIPQRDIARLTDLPPSISCTVFAYSRGDSSSYAHAVAVIRAELPRLLRTSCIHEELAQGLGLANDSPAARPSIFNDDEEFALLTRHDELLLQILYDPRLRVGMVAAEAEPVVRRIATELLGEST